MIQRLIEAIQNALCRHRFISKPERRVTFHADGRMTVETEHVTKYAYCQRCGIINPEFRKIQEQRQIDGAKQ